MTQIISLDAFRQNRATLLADIRGETPEETTVPITQASALLPALVEVTADGQFFDYGRILMRTMRRMVAEVLKEVETNGLPTGSTILIQFETIAPGVEMPPHLLDAFPREMTIILDQWWKDLFVTETGMTVTLSFYGQAETLTIPFSAMRAMHDPNCGFAVSMVPAPSPEPHNPQIA